MPPSRRRRATGAGYNPAGRLPCSRRATPPPSSSCSTTQAFEKEGAQILGISFDPVAKNAAFAGKFGFGFPLLSDTDREVGRAYGAAVDPGAQYALRLTYLIGPDGRIRKIYFKVDPATHPKQVLDDLSAPS